MRPFGQRGRWLEGPATVRRHPGGSQFGRTVIYGDDAADLACTLDGRTSIVGVAAIADVASDAADIVDHVGDRDQYLGRIHDHAQWSALATAVTSLVEYLRAERVVTICQRGGRCEAPLAIGTHIDFADCLAVVVDDDLAIWLGTAAEHRAVIVSGITSVQRASHISHVIGDGQTHHVVRRGGVDAEVPPSRRFTALTYAVGGGGNHLMRTVGQFVGGDTPVTTGIDHGAADQSATVIELDDAATISGALEGRCAVVSDITFLQEALIWTDIVMDADDSRYRWRTDHNVNAVLRAWIGLVARYVHLDSGQVIRTGNQRKCGGQLPCTVSTYCGATDLMVTGTVLAEDDNGIASSTLTTDLRTRIIGFAAIRDITGDRRHMVFHASNQQFGNVRRGGIDINHDNGRWTGVSSSVRRSDTDVVVTLRQWFARRNRPVAVFIRRGRENLSGGQCDLHIGMRLCMAVDGWLGLIGDAVALDARIRVRVQPDLGGIRSNGIHYHHERVRRRTDITRNIGHGHRDVMGTFRQWLILWSFIAPLAILTDDCLGNLLATIVQGDGLIRLTVA